MPLVLFLTSMCPTQTKCQMSNCIRINAKHSVHERPQTSRQYLGLLGPPWPVTLSDIPTRFALHIPYCGDFSNTRALLELKSAKQQPQLISLSRRPKSHVAAFSP